MSKAPNEGCPRPCEEALLGWTPDRVSVDQITDCVGMLATSRMSGWNPDGYQVEVCPRTSTVGQDPGFIERGIGPDVVTIRSATPISSAEAKAVIDYFDEG